MTSSDRPSDGSLSARDSGVRVVLVADRSGEAERIASALSEEGFSVVTSDVVALPERASRLDPFAVLVDVEQAHADAAVARLREGRDDQDASSGSRPGRDAVLVALGTRRRAAELGIESGPRSRVFQRPVDLDALTAYLREIATFGASMSRGDVPSSPGSFPLALDSDSLLLSDFPAIAGLPEVESVLPDLENGPASAQLAAQLSPEIEALLEQSAKRVRDDVRHDDRHPSTELDITVPPDVLAALDELLLPEEEGRPAGASSADTPLPPTEYGSDAERTPAPASSQGRASDVPKTAAGSSERTNIRAQGDRADADDSVVPRTAEQQASGWPLSREPATTQRDRGPPFGADPAAGAPLSRAEHIVVRHQGPSEPPSSNEDGSEPPPPTHAGAELFSTDHPRMLEQSLPHSVRGARPRPTMASGPPTSADLAMPFSSRHPGAATRVQPMDEAPASAEAAPPQTKVGGFLGVAPTSERTPPADPAVTLAAAVRGRATGSLFLGGGAGERVRRILLRDGDLVNAISDVPDEALVHFLVGRGDLRPEVAELRSLKLPQAGRHAAAALIANGFLSQDDLWPVLRAHAEWVIGRALVDDPALCHLEANPPERLNAEPNVFGGAAGVEVFVETVRRMVPPEQAIARLGGASSELDVGPAARLISESALSNEEVDAVRMSVGKRLGDALTTYGAEFAALLYALATLDILARTVRRQAAPVPLEEPFDPLDSDAVRKRVRARLALVRDADYFALLGVSPSSTPYEIRRAYLELRRAFEPTRILTAATADLADDVDLIVEVLDEAYEILRDGPRRARYRRAIEATG